MGLDIYVMPLWKFFAGRFESDSESAAVETTEQTTRQGSDTPRDPNQVARDRVQLLRASLSQGCGSEIAWPDEGNCVVSTQFLYSAVHAIRAFAAYQDYPLPEPGRKAEEGFTLKDAPKRWPPWPQLPGGKPNWSDPDFHPSLLKVYGGAQTRYPHLIDHLDHGGFYVPCDFKLPIPLVEHFQVHEEQATKSDGVANEKDDAGGIAAMAWFIGMLGIAPEKKARKQLEKKGAWADFNKSLAEKDRANASVRDWHKVGSSRALLVELDELGKLLGMTRDWGQMEPGGSVAPMEDVLGEVKYGWSVLHYCARVSVETRLPIIFNG